MDMGRPISDTKNTDVTLFPYAFVFDIVLDNISLKRRQSVLCLRETRRTTT